jgi:riboflavin biosynthesis pyrimidine reductase
MREDLRVTFPRERGIPSATPGAADPAMLALYEHAPGTVRLNLIASADGKAAGPDGSSRSINGPEDLRVLRAIRSWADVVLVGARTARSERYSDIAVADHVRLERERRGQPAQPRLALVTWSGELPAGLTPESTWVITSAQSPAANSLREEWEDRLIIAGDAELDARAAIAGLHAAGMNRIVCEGGPSVAGWLLAADAVDEYCLSRSPLPGGIDAAPVPAVPSDMDLGHRLEGGGFTMERWLRSERY